MPSDDTEIIKTIEPDDFFQGEWDYQKLYTGLHAAAFGGWYLAQARVCATKMIYMFFFVALSWLGISLVLSLRNLCRLVAIQQSAFLSCHTKGSLGGLDKLKEYNRIAIRNFSVFIFGVALAGATLLFSVFHQMPWKMSFPIPTLFE